VTGPTPPSAPGQAPSTPTHLVFGAARLLLVIEGLSVVAFWFVSAGNRPVAVTLFGDTEVARQLAGVDTLTQFIGCIALAAGALFLILFSAYLAGRLALMAGYVAFLYAAFVQGGGDGLHPAPIELAIVGGLVCALLIATLIL
jgi:hypothetical protein